MFHPELISNYLFRSANVGSDASNEQESTRNWLNAKAAALALRIIVEAIFAAKKARTTERRDSALERSPKTVNFRLSSASVECAPTQYPGSRPTQPISTAAAAQF